MTLMMLLVFGVLLVLALPVGYALLISSGLAAITVGDIPTVAAVVKVFQPTQSFPLLAILFFVLSGNLMMGGTLGTNLIQFATALVGRLHGGLGQVTVVGSTVIGGVSGSAVAVASALGSVLTSGSNTWQGYILSDGPLMTGPAPCCAPAFTGEWRFLRVVPEPATLTLLLLAVLGIGLVRGRKPKPKVA